VIGDRQSELEAIEALLRAIRDSSTPATDVELDVEFDAIMSFLDNIDDEQAAELDNLVARARGAVTNVCDVAASMTDAVDADTRTNTDQRPTRHTMTRTSWRKSGFSSDAVACVEVCSDGEVTHVRDSKNIIGPTFTFGDGWSTFLAKIKMGRLR
jgi:uncharacterized protein DUF397